MEKWIIAVLPFSPNSLLNEYSFFILFYCYKAKLIFMFYFLWLEISEKSCWRGGRRCSRRHLFGRRCLIWYAHLPKKESAPEACRNVRLGTALRWHAECRVIKLYVITFPKKPGKKWVGRGNGDREDARYGNHHSRGDFQGTILNYVFL